MWILLAHLAVVGVGLGALAVLVAVALGRAAGGAYQRRVAAALLLVLGTYPPSALSVFWYARGADYVWAIRGPGLFGHLGGGPAMLALLVLVFLWTATCWTAALWLLGER